VNNTVNIQINAIAFSDSNPSNNPMLRAWDLTYKLFGLTMQNAENRPYTIGVGASQTIYDGTRTTLADNTTQFDVTRPSAAVSVFRLSHNGTGTAPVFRTDRALGLSTSTSIVITVNGPVSTLTSLAGPFNTSNVQVGDTLLVQTAGCSAANQGRFTIIAKTSTSVSVQNLNASAETFTVLDASQLLIFSSGASANQPQIGDKLMISSGFSVASNGTYTVTEVTPSWIEISVGNVYGLPLESGIAPGTGMIIYKTVKQFVLLASQQKVSVAFNDGTSSDVVEPAEVNNAERPGLLLKTGSFYKLVITNQSLDQANVSVAMAE
jgi:hypothetical protein